MAIRPIAQLKAWFKRGAYPTAEQFADWLDSYFHKEEKVPIGSVDGLAERLNAKYDQTAGEELERRHNELVDNFNTHVAGNAAEHTSLFEADRELGKRIDAEVQRATSAEEALDKRVDAEVTRATGAEKALSDRIDINTAAITAETSRAKGAETALSSRVDKNAADITTVQVDLVETHQIAEGASRALSFATKQQLDSWIAGTYTRPDGKTTADLRVGDNLYVEDVDSPDYWWSESGLSVLETEKVDLSDFYNKQQSDLLLDAEFERALAVETILEERIDTEAQRATIAEKALSDRIDINTAAITAETSRAKGAETALNQRIDEVAAAGGAIVIPPPVWQDVTRLFDIPSTAHIQIFLVDDGVVAPMLHIFAHDTSGHTADLDIVVPRGLGSLLDLTANNAFIVWAWDTNGSAQPHPVTVTAETPLTESVIHLPAQITKANLAYAVGTGEYTGSHAVDASGTYHALAPDNTPVANLATTTGPAGVVMLNNASITKNSVKTLVFGTEYNPVRQLPDYFLFWVGAAGGTVDFRGFTGVTAIGGAVGQSCKLVPSFQGLENVTTVGTGFFANANLEKAPDLYPLRNGRTFGSNFLSGNSFPDIDISPLAGVQSFGVQSFAGNPALKAIQIGALDFANITVGDNVFNGCPATGIVFADTIAGGQALQAKCPALEGWTVRANGGSYYVDDAGDYIFFDAIGTPLSALSNAGDATSTVLVNGVEVVKNATKEWTLGDDYAAQIELPDNFMRSTLYHAAGSAGSLLGLRGATRAGNSVFRASRLAKVDLRGLEGLKTVGNFFFSEAYGDPTRIIDFSPLRGLEVGGDYFFLNATIYKLDISPLVGLRQLGQQAFGGIAILREIQIGRLDFSQIALGANSFSGLSATGTIWVNAGNQASAGALIAKTPALANWTIQVNETPVNP